MNSLSPYARTNSFMFRLAACSQSYPVGGEGSFLLNVAKHLEIILCSVTTQKTVV